MQSAAFSAYPGNIPWLGRHMSDLPLHLPQSGGRFASSSPLASSVFPEPPLMLQTRSSSLVDALKHLLSRWRCALGH
eukprot:scaffold177344_cov17-Tisochrysis_lutea.AAC.1